MVMQVWQVSTFGRIVGMRNVVAAQGLLARYLTDLSHSLWESLCEVRIYSTIVGLTIDMSR